jgi:uncharacterized protein
VIFLDTGGFLGKYATRDQYHQLAIAGWREIEASSMRCVTSNFVLDEMLTLLGRRTSYEFAAERARRLLTSKVLEILRPDQEHELEALTDFEKFADQGVSFTDCVSFALMRSRRIRRVFSFDRHFALAGFELWPGRWTSVHEPAPEYDSGQT